MQQSKYENKERNNIRAKIRIKERIIFHADKMSNYIKPIKLFELSSLKQSSKLKEANTITINGVTLKIKSIKKTTKNGVKEKKVFVHVRN